MDERFNPHTSTPQHPNPYLGYRLFNRHVAVPHQVQEGYPLRLVHRLHKLRAERMRSVGSSSQPIWAAFGTGPHKGLVALRTLWTGVGGGPRIENRELAGHRVWSVFQQRCAGEGESDEE